jgi:hypothetical protein
VIAAGYLFKRLMPRSDWIKNAAVKDIYSVSRHLSEDFAEYINYWKHNGWWLFNRPADMSEIIERERVDRTTLTLFYYEVFEQQYDEDEKKWFSVEPEKSFITDVERPLNAQLEGFDVVTFSNGATPECSPLSCNSLADEIQVNEHCLIESLDASKAALEMGKFDNSEPGPFRIFAVYTMHP